MNHGQINILTATGIKGKIFTCLLKISDFYFSCVKGVIPYLLTTLYILNSLYAGLFFQFLLSSADFFFSILFFTKSCKNTISMSNGLDPDQDQHFVSPTLGPNCSQRLSADDKKCQLVILFGSQNIHFVYLANILDPAQPAPCS